MNFVSLLRYVLLSTALVSALSGSPARAADDAEAAAAGASAAKAYRLAPGDLIELSVFMAPEFATSQRLDASGVLQVPLLGEVEVGGRSVREAQQRVATAFVERGLLVKPAVTIAVREYAVRQAFVFGQVGSQGPVLFPPEKEQIDLVEVIAMAGGFTRIAKKKLVRITRVGPDGKSESRTYNVDAMIDGRPGPMAERVFVRPGDVINVEESIT